MVLLLCILYLALGIFGLLIKSKSTMDVKLIDCS